MIQNISIIPDSAELVNNMIRTIHQYYPLGFEFINEQYFGFAELCKIVEEKVVQVMEDKLPAEIRILKANLEKMYPGLQIQFDLYRSFPSYSISIPICSQDFESLDRSLMFSLKISLLSNYYTFFFEERVRHKNTVHSPKGHPVVTTIISQEAQTGDNEREMARQIKSKFLECYPSYQFVSHYQLFLIKVNGVPFGQDSADPKRDYLLYDFLFESGIYRNYTFWR